MARTARVTCNMLGATALGFRHRDDVTELTGLLGDMGIAVNVVAPLDATPADIARLGAAHFNVLLYPETGRSCRALAGKDAMASPSPRPSPSASRATRDFIAEVAAIAGLAPRPTRSACASPGGAASVDSTYLTGKRVFIFGDATHVMAAARIAANEIGFEVVGLGCYNRELARPMRAAPRTTASRR